MNYGAFFQAYVLLNVIKKKNNKVSFLKTNARKNFIISARLAFKSLINLNLKNALFEIKKYLIFTNNTKRYKISKNLNKQDIFVFGSDEIWNIGRKQINKYPILYGVGVPDKVLISYAPSINMTTLEEIRANTAFIKSIQTFEAISVRDTYSKNIIQEITKKEVKEVLDPTFLFNMQSYESIEKNIDESQFILIYGYPSRFKSQQINQIIEFSKNKKLKLLSVGNFLHWCDNNIVVSPFSFLSYVKKANYVITNTFHGTIFSIIYQKQFVTYAENQIKIEAILKKFDLFDRNVSNSKNIELIIDKKIDYLNVGFKIEHFANESREYLNKYIND
jgi:hypothetical protein